MAQQRKTPRLTPAQQREILHANPVTGQLTGKATMVHQALRSAELAEAYGHTGRLYLNEAGRAMRDRLLATAAALDVPVAPAGTDRFAPATGNEALSPAAVSGQRTEAVGMAWASVLEMRRVWGRGAPDALSVPAPWERSQMVRAVALALAAGGAPPSAVGADGARAREGYLVTDSVEPGVVRVDWLGPEVGKSRLAAKGQLQRCAGLLCERGWEALLYRGHRATWFLLVSPREAATDSTGEEL